MIPAYKVILFTSFGSSMYMMGRLVLVCLPHWLIMSIKLTECTGAQDVVWQELNR